MPVVIGGGKKLNTLKMKTYLMAPSKPARRPRAGAPGEIATRVAGLRIIRDQRRRDRGAIEASMREILGTDLLRMGMAPNRSVLFESFFNQVSEFEETIRKSSLSEKEKGAQLQALKKSLEILMHQRPGKLPAPNRRTWN